MRPQTLRCSTTTPLSRSPRLMTRPHAPTVTLVSALWHAAPRHSNALCRHWPAARFSAPPRRVPRAAMSLLWWYHQARLCVFWRKHSGVRQSFHSADVRLSVRLFDSRVAASKTPTVCCCWAPPPPCGRFTSIWYTCKRSVCPLPSSTMVTRVQTATKSEAGLEFSISASTLNALQRCHSSLVVTRRHTGASRSKRRLMALGLACVLAQQILADIFSFFLHRKKFTTRCNSPLN